MSHAKREVGAACALLLVQRRSRDNRVMADTVVRDAWSISSPKATRRLLRQC